MSRGIRNHNPGNIDYISRGIRNNNPGNIDHNSANKWQGQLDWHVFILINIFGFVRPLIDEQTGEIVLRNDGSGRPVMVRRYRTAYNEVARKNAKSTLSSGIGLLSGERALNGNQTLTALPPARLSPFNPVIR
ncbi:hypothetical protein XBKQ1_780004 [Xenorhabdus bovienii str. kraussei Quebec]|uniref:Uncharacterized protein n=1 Tax=Xenorhabdus bovienii str. kraussei Quebec TaxID=1398203 RepID=A0A077PMB3_XENBV|nr:hypothetical protein XBKQ1_780004 [Xenorhabdus bovienii str. kraussei Quebec]